MTAARRRQRSSAGGSETFRRGRVPRVPLGFANPPTYSIGLNSSQYAADFRDITSGSTGAFNAVAGYDLVTGWGTPKAALIFSLSSNCSATVTLAPQDQRDGVTIPASEERFMAGYLDICLRQQAVTQAQYNAAINALSKVKPTADLPQPPG